MAARPPMHPGQLTPTADVVAALVAAQFPAWAARPVTPVDSTGTVNALFRLGDDSVARLPLNPDEPAAARAEIGREMATARRLAAADLPAATPEPNPSRSVHQATVTRCRGRCGAGSPA